MDDGGAFIWLIFIVLAVLQTIGQKKKRKAGQLGQKQPGQAPPRPTAPRGQEHPGLSAGQGKGSPSASSPAQASTIPEGGEAGSSEGMIPSDVWAEILGLARGAPQGEGQGLPAPTGTTPGPHPGEEGPREVESSEPQPLEIQPVELRSRQGRPREMRPREVRSRETTPAESVVRREGREAPATRTFPTSHGASAALHETDPSDFESRLHVPDSSADAGGSKGSEGREGIREGLFGSGSVEELRKAIILKEVLGAPLALRDE